MAGAPASFVDSLRGIDQPFHIDDVAAVCPDLSRDTIRVYLSMATSEGVLERVGSGIYRFAERPAKETSSYPPLEKLRANVLPNVWRRLVVWSDEDVAGFVHDAVMTPFLVIEAPRNAIRTIRNLLERNGTQTITLKNRRHIMESIQGTDRHRRALSEGPVVLLPNDSLTGTRVSGHGYRIPEHERLFLDFLGDDPYAIEYLAEATPRYGLDPVRLLKAASSRKRTDEIASMLTTVIALHPRHPMRAALTERWPWIERLG